MDTGWTKLSVPLLLDATFQGKFLWASILIRNTSANTMIIKSKTGATAPSTDSGINLTASTGIASGVSIDAGNQGIIDGNIIWIKCSGNATTFDITFVRKIGIGG